MEPDNVERNLQSLRRLYGLLDLNARNESIPEPYLLDENTQFLLKRLLDFASHELFVHNQRYATILATQLGLFPRTDLRSLKPSNVADSSVKASPAVLSQINGSQNTQSGKPLEVKGTLKRINQIQSSPTKDGLTEEVADAIEQIDTQLSALSFVSSRVDSDDRTRSCKSRSLITHPIEERRQNFQASTSGLRSNYMPMSQRCVNSGADVTVGSHDDQFVGVLSRPQPLPHLAVRSVGFKKPGQSKRTSQKMPSMKPTLMMDQETETLDDDSIESESEQTHSGRSWDSEDEELISTEQESDESSGEIGSSSGSNWETQAESDKASESDSSYPPVSDDDDESGVSASPPHKNRDRSSDLAKQRKNAMGRFKRLKKKIGQVFHHNHHHHHHHHHHEKNKPSAWKNLQSTFHQKHKEKSDERRRTTTESKGITTHKQHRGGHFHALVEGLMRHRKHSKKQKHNLQSHAKKTQWWKTLKKRQGVGVKFPNRGRVKLGKQHYLSKNVQEHE